MEYEGSFFDFANGISESGQSGAQSADEASHVVPNMWCACKRDLQGGLSCRSSVGPLGGDLGFGSGGDRDMGRNKGLLENENGKIEDLESESNKGIKDIKG